MRSYLSFLIASLIGATVIVNGVSLRAEDILKETKSVVDETNIHQIETALEIYYINKGYYPNVINKEDMLAELSSAGHLSRVPNNLLMFSYNAINQGETYDLNY
jgi:hypothetical protein